MRTQQRRGNRRSSGEEERGYEFLFARLGKTGETGQKKKQETNTEETKGRSAPSRDAFERRSEIKRERWMRLGGKPRTQEGEEAQSHRENWKSPSARPSKEVGDGGVYHSVTKPMIQRRGKRRGDEKEIRKSSYRRGRWRGKDGDLLVLTRRGRSRKQRVRRDGRRQVGKKWGTSKEQNVIQGKAY